MIPIYINQDEQIIGVSRSVPQMPTGMDPEDEEEQHIQEAIQRSLESRADQRKLVTEIPTPNVRTVEPVDSTALFTKKKDYITYEMPGEAELLSIVEYDLDSEDFKFLKSFNCKLEPKDRISEDALEEFIDKFEKGKQKISNFTLAKAEKSVSELKTEYGIDSKTTAAIFKYWSTKRAKLKRPLLDRFVPPPDIHDPSPFVAFRPREISSKHKKNNRKNDRAAFAQLTQLRREFERARMLLEMIKKREKQKRERITVLHDLFEQIRNSEIPHAITISKRNNRRKKIGYGFKFVAADLSEEECVEEQETTDSSDSEYDDTDKEECEEIPQFPHNPFPTQVHGLVFLGRGQRPFRGRARIGRGGRLIFDRYKIPWVTKKDSKLRRTDSSLMSIINSTNTIDSNVNINTNITTTKEQTLSADSRKDDTLHSLDFSEAMDLDDTQSQQKSDNQNTDKETDNTENKTKKNDNNSNNNKNKNTNNNDNNNSTENKTNETNTNHCNKLNGVGNIIVSGNESGDSTDCIFNTKSLTNNNTNDNHTDSNKIVNTNEDIKEEQIAVQIPDLGNDSEK
eukprot:CAMPEP_0174250742 /NCGR_PEP_ID=MMETSP0439-20130205/818_1 /TAXON_ID=0 /ORGANISM="Stereomyxa ramosa, Strain Chinc5" /LENGTH=566 /DNA_ID=CAMNT_0015330889 /DNA_START=172 /DNA_END=1873 /DNA_ORIENTATION=-